MSWTGCEQQRVASPRGVACIIVRIATTEVKRLLKKSKKRRERLLFFLFFLSGLFFFCMCARGAPKMIIVTYEYSYAIKNSLNSTNTQFSLQFLHKIHSRCCCYFSVKAKSEYAHHQTNNGNEQSQYRETERK